MNSLTTYQQQIYNNMQAVKLNLYANTVTENIISQIITKAEEKIRSNQFVKRNQPSWVVHSHQNYIDNAISSLKRGPDRSPSKVDIQPINIPQDTFMNTGPATGQGFTPTIFEPKKSSLGNTSYQKSVKKSKNSNYSILSVSSNRHQPQLQDSLQKKFESIPKHPLDTPENSSFIDRLRQFKIEEELLKQNPVEEKPIAVCKLQRGEQVVFDYEGRFSKRRQNKANEFKYNHLHNSSPEQPKEPKKRSVSHCLPSTKKGNSVVILSRMLAKHSKQPEEGEQVQERRHVEFNNSNKKDDMLKSIQINSPGIRITVDGAVVKRDRAITQAERSRISQKVKTVQIRNSFEKINRIKTDNVIENTSRTNRDLPSTKRPSRQPKRRVGTEASIYSVSKVSKISVENYSLHQMILEGDPLESKYIEIPFKKANQKRFKTIADAQSLRQNSEIDSVRMRDKLTNFNKDLQSLPRISSHYRQAESQVMKILRKKQTAV